MYKIFGKYKKKLLFCGREFNKPYLMHALSYRDMLKSIPINYQFYAKSNLFSYGPHDFIGHAVAQLVGK